MEIPEKYAPYFTNLDTPSVITDNDFKIVWKSKATDKLQYHIRKGASIKYYLTKKQFSMLKRIEPGDSINLTFLLDEPTNGFCKRKDDCYIFRISRFNGAAHQRISEIFDQRYGGTALVASSIPDSPEPFPAISGTRLDRLTSMFEGLFSEGLIRMDISVPIMRFSRQATCALSGITVRNENEEGVMYVDINIHDLYMALTAMVVCLLSYAPGVTEIVIGREKVGTDGVLKVSCEYTGIADAIADVYSDTDKLETLCEYGAHYLNLVLISTLSDYYGWEFNVSEENGWTTLSITFTLIWNKEAHISLFTGDPDDGIDIVPLLLAPFKKNK